MILWLDIKKQPVSKLNGAEYRDVNGGIVEHTYIEKSRVVEILDTMKSKDISIEIYTDDGFYTTNTKEETLEGMVRRLFVFNPEIKEVAKYITDTNVNFGVAKAIHRILNGEL